MTFDFDLDPVVARSLIMHIDGCQDLPLKGARLHVFTVANMCCPNFRALSASYEVRAVQSDAIPADATDAGDKGTDLLQSVPNSEASASASTELTEPRRWLCQRGELLDLRGF